MRKRKVCAYMVNQISQSTVSQGTQRLFSSPAFANQYFLIKQLVNMRNKSCEKKLNIESRIKNISSESSFIGFQLTCSQLFQMIEGWLAKKVMSDSQILRTKL